MSTPTSAQLQNLMLPHAALPLGEQQSDGDLRRQVGSHDRTTMLNKHLHWIERKKEIVLGGSMM